MGQFREGHIDILVATDLAARGIDVKEISYVVHYHLPDTYDTYVHRSGRTARAGAKGFSWAIIQEEELVDIPHFEQELDLTFTALKKEMLRVWRKIKDCFGLKKYLKPNRITKYLLLLEHKLELFFIT